MKKVLAFLSVIALAAIVLPRIQASNAISATHSIWSADGGPAPPPPYRPVNAISESQTILSADGGPAPPPPYHVTL
jgi:hypothetical protein